LRLHLLRFERFQKTLPKLCVFELFGTRKTETQGKLKGLRFIQSDFCIPL
jgi:hypothetical protein